MKQKNLIIALIMAGMVLKLSSTFAQDIQWQKCLGGTDVEEVHFIQQTTDSCYIIAGYTRSNDGDVSGNHNAGDADYWIVKLNQSGDTLWTKCFGGTDVDIARAIQQTTDGGYIIAGNSNSSDGDVNSNYGGHDAWVLKLDPSGDTLWTKRFGGSSWDYANSIQQTTDGGYIFAGNTNSNDIDVWGNHGDPDYWVVKLDQFGDTLWTKCLGGTGNEQALLIQQTFDDGYIRMHSTK